MTPPATYDDPEFRTAERALARRRLVAAVITVLAFTGIAGGSLAGALAGAHDDRVDQAPTSQAPTSQAPTSQAPTSQMQVF
ncbi:MAG TPA: hypothetical protein VFJ89_08175 [Nocardioides sp.]|jgi:hypothetical protein|nr:hypothetical protein [Nocardioides sp.]